MLLREVIAKILLRDLAFPDGAMVTVTRVAPSDDLYYATAFVTILAPKAGAEGTVLAELKRVTGLVQHELNRTLRMRPVPKISFALDQNEQRRERVEKLLNEQK